MKPLSVRPWIWIAAAFVLLLGLAAPGVAQAHVHAGAHPVQAASSAAAHHASVETVVAAALPAGVMGQKCHEACCASGASCCLVSCVTDDVATLPSFDGRSVAIGRTLEAHRGIEPSGLLEPPIAR